MRRQPLGFIALVPFALGLGLAACRPSHGRSHGDTTVPGTGSDGGMVVTDPNADNDKDGYTPAKGDCDDSNPDIHPGAKETCDGRDHNCNGIVDDICDDDHDGYAVCPGPNCTTVMGSLPGGDCADNDPLVNPGAMEVYNPPNHVDDNCNGQTDEMPDCKNAMLGATNPLGFAAAMEICDPWVVSAKFSNGSSTQARKITNHYGSSYKPHAGATMVAMSNGIAADEHDPGWDSTNGVQPGGPNGFTGFGNTAPNPLPMTNSGSCGSSSQDPTTVNDYTEVTLQLKVPTNANSFSFDFNFMSAEYPEFVGTEYNDKFLVILKSSKYSGNVSFDKKKNPITVNAGFFDVCQTAPICSGSKTNNCTKSLTELNGTGYELDDGTGQAIGGGTGWLTTQAPVQPGETITLRFVIFDEGDFIYDSAVLIDNFQWQVTASMGPATNPS